MYKSGYLACVYQLSHVKMQSHSSNIAPGQPAAAVLNAKASRSEGKSLESFLASLAVASAIFILEMALYIWLRVRLPSL